MTLRLKHHFEWVSALLGGMAGLGDWPEPIFGAIFFLVAFVLIAGDLRADMHMLGYLGGSHGAWDLLDDGSPERHYRVTAFSARIVLLLGILGMIILISIRALS